MLQIVLFAPIMGPLFVPCSAKLVPIIPIIWAIWQVGCYCPTTQYPCLISRTSDGIIRPVRKIGLCCHREDGYYVMMYP